MRPKIIDQHASGMSDIVDACPVSVFAKSGNGVRIKAPNDCIGCGICTSMCNGIKLIN